MSIELPDEVSNYIAENIQSNIRQLEGAVKKIKAMHELMGERITVSLAENAIDASALVVSAAVAHRHGQLCRLCVCLSA